MSYVSEQLEKVIKKNPGEPEFHQAVTEVLHSLEVVIEKNPQYQKEGLGAPPRAGASDHVPRAVG